MKDTVEGGRKQGRQQISSSDNINGWADMTMPTDHPGGRCPFLLPLTIELVDDDDDERK